MVELRTASGQDITKDDFNDFLTTMDLIDIERNADELVEEHLDFDSRKEAFKDQLRRTYEENGVSVTESQLDRGVEAHYSARWRFQPGKDNFSRKLANAYINRGLAYAKKGDYDSTIINFNKAIAMNMR